ncbi:MFS transporter [Natronolimnohabitans innermongolicus]|uniref:Major facilitator superfamily protein n=1 Tax=Natronolimnohabitans innermongolicus JCM 12255 TaxID=1227499 RepID=L9WL23_9EURY|nr:MFS transporter [Natronolimnohabitans innermongolicus]ELY50164.1 major facilitator superfamily protein [Natronolimnohabitans innermongolicus JCM 12255]
MGTLDAVRRELAGLWADGKGKSLLAIALGWGLLNGTRMIYPVLLPYFSDEFGLTLTTAGFLVTVIWLAYAIGQVPGGILADRYGERTILTVSVSFALFGLVLVLLAPSALVLFGATALVGLGLSQYPIARITALSDLYPDRIGRALGVTMAAGDIGQTVLPPVASVLAVAVGWRLGLGYVLPFLCLTVAIIWWTLPNPEPDDTEGTDTSIRAVADELRSPTVVIMGVMLFLFIFVWQTFSAFYPTYLVEEKELSPTAAGALFGLFFAVGVVVKPLAGAAYDRIGIRGSLPLVLGGSILGLASLPFVDGVGALLAVTVLISTMLGSGAITQSYLAEITPDDVQGTGLGLVRSSTAMLGATGPVVFGAVAERGYFDEGYVVLAAIVGVVTALTLLLPTD